VKPVRVVLAVAGLTVALAGPVAQAQKPPQAVEKVSGYAEWRRGNTIIVDGQRVVAEARTQFKGRGITSLESIPLGYEVESSGVRRSDGAILASVVEAKPNGNGLFEQEIRNATDEVEAKWLQAGAMVEPVGENKVQVVGKLVPSGPDVARVGAIIARVAPPYVKQDALRIHVVDTREWNAMAMGNGAVWVFTGLLHDMDDDEVAIVVGHELAHYTHEHSRREFKRAMWGQLIALGAIAGTAAATDSKTTQGVVALASLFTVMTVRNGYSRDLEVQADRVWLRYAYEVGYDVRKGPRLWGRFRDRYGESNGIMNFFLGDHSRASARVRNLEREIALNYSGQSQIR
jgi:Zn-dependent protease with chaperone function